MKLAVQKNYLGFKILYRSPDRLKKRRQSNVYEKSFIV